MVVLLAITAPFASIFGAMNIIFRVPDFFNYEFDRTEVSRSLDLGIGNSELSNFFSKFMLHSHDKFSLVTEYQGTQRELFTQLEASVAGNLRMILDILMVVAVISLIVMVFIIFMMQYNIRPKTLRLSLNIGLVFYFAFMGGMVLLFNVSNGDATLVHRLAGKSFGVDDLLYQMFDSKFTLDATVAISVISLIAMLIIRYTVWKMTSHRGVFSESLKGVGI